MDPIHALVDRHLSTWNSSPGDDRAEDIAAVYTDDVFVGESGASYTGHGGVEQAISGLQSAIPGMTLSLRGGIQTAQDMSTYAWELGPGGAPPVATGRDVILVTGGRISRIYVVIDAP
jgi:hypothetical protein